MLLNSNATRGPTDSLLLSDPRVAARRGYWVVGRGVHYLIGDAASRRGLCTGRVFHHAQRPVERAPA